MSSIASASSDRLVRRVFLGLTVLFVVFIAYASLTPGNQAGALERRSFRSLAELPGLYRVHDLRDLTTNVLLYIPLGLCLALAAWRPTLRFMSPYLLVGLGVSLAMEVSQSFIGRFPDAIDVMANGVGHMIGWWVVVAGVRFYGLRPGVLLGVDADDGQYSKTRTIGAVRFMYVCIYVLVALLPFDVSVSLSNIYSKLVPDADGDLRIVLDPLYHLRHWQDTGLTVTLELLGLVPAGGLTAFLSLVRGRPALIASIFSCVLLALCCEVAQVFIMSRTSDIVAIPIAVVAGILGWGLGRVWFDLQNIETERKAATREASWKTAMVAVIGYALVIAFFAWSPFRFETNLRKVAAKVLHESNVIPFKQHFAARGLSSAVDIVKEAGLFVPMGILVAYTILSIAPAASRGRIVVGATAACFVYATLMELTQAVCVGRYIDVSDVLLAACGGACGAMLLRLFLSDAPRMPAS